MGGVLTRKATSAASILMGFLVAARVGVVGLVTRERFETAEVRDEAGPGPGSVVVLVAVWALAATESSAAAEAEAEADSAAVSVCEGSGSGWRGSAIATV